MGLDKNARERICKGFEFPTLDPETSVQVIETRDHTSVFIRIQKNGATPTAAKLSRAQLEMLFGLDVVSEPPSQWGMNESQILCRDPPEPEPEGPRLPDGRRAMEVTDPPAD